MLGRQRGVQHTDMYRLLVSNVEDYAIFLLDTEGCVLTWNKGAQKLKGYTESEIVGKHFSTFYTKKDNANRKPAWELEECRAKGRVEDEGWRVRRDGSRFWANVVITAMYDEENTFVGYAKVTRDLSERKRHEDSLCRANELLRRQRIELEALNSTKDEFISIASHQLRTPATGVKQFLGLVLEGYAGDIDGRAREFIQKAYESNDRQINLVNDLLRVAQIDAGNVTLSKRAVNITALIRAIIDEQIDTIHGRKQYISYATPDKDMYAEVDEMRYRMVLENLIDNASKYTPKSGKIIVTLVEHADDIVSVSIRDTGVGISEHALPKLFKKFSRIANDLSDLVGGSGLGLYWAHQIITLHSGTIAVDSTVGEGSNFIVRVPKGDV